MIPHLPATQALRAFESAARHLSYSRAADELFLTHGAVSHHVARLQEELGVTLFVREGQRMVLTDAGQDLVMGVRQGLKTLAAAMDNARKRPGRERRRSLSISVLPSFAARWLVPRLSRFQALHPDIDIAIHPRSTLAALDGNDGIDLAIRYGPGSWPGLAARLLMKSTVFPVCSPAFLANTPITSPGDLLDVTLLRSPRQAWQLWFAAAGIEQPEPAHGPVYDDAALLLQAAENGQGVALARSALAFDDLATGRLVRLLDVEIEDEYGWFLAWREPTRADPGHFEAFANWLRQEAADLQTPTPAAMQATGPLFMPASWLSP